MGGGPELDEARGHHGEVGHHVIGPQEGMEGLHDFPDLAGLEGQLLIDLLAFLIPAPGVFEGANLAGGVGAVLFVEEGVVVLGGVEGRVQIDEINRLVLQIPPHDVEIVAVIKRAHAPSVAGGPPGINAGFSSPRPSPSELLQSLSSCIGGEAGTRFRRFQLKRLYANSGLLALALAGE